MTPIKSPHGDIIDLKHVDGAFIVTMRLNEEGRRIMDQVNKPVGLSLGYDGKDDAELIIISEKEPRP